MTELKLTLPDSLARDARKAGLLTPKAIGELLRDAMRRRAARAFLSNAPRVAQAKIPPMSAGSRPRSTRFARPGARRVRVVADTNTIVSALLWRGNPYRLIAAIDTTACASSTPPRLCDRSRSKLQRQLSTAAK